MQCDPGDAVKAECIQTCTIEKSQPLTKSPSGQVTPPSPNSESSDHSTQISAKVPATTNDKSTSTSKIVSAKDPTTTKEPTTTEEPITTTVVTDSGTNPYGFSDDH